MRTSSKCFLVVLLTINSAKICEGLCEYVKKEVKCESVSAISDRVMNQIPNIREANRLSIKSNQELKIFPESFKSAVNLQRIIINNNKIDKIYADTFKNLAVKYLNIAFNGINSMFPNSFTNLSFLEELRVDNNNMEQIPLGVFTNLPLQKLTLSKNRISIVDNMALENLPNLTKLALDNNKIKSIFIHQILTYPERLELLWLHNNSLTGVSNYMLQKLTNLEVLNLGFNEISLIEPKTFEQTPKLRYLILTHNHLKQIDGNIFPKTGMNYLDKMYLDNNKLMFLSSNFIFRLGALKKITIVGNPWFCHCLTVVQKLLQENLIQAMCAEDYTSGERPICVSENPDETECRHIYNDALSEKYEDYKRNNPLYRSTISCIL